MARRPTATGAGVGAAIAVLSLLGTLLPRPASGQIEQRAEERTEELARIEVEEVALGRHLLSRQQLAIWLPEGWEEKPGSGGGPVIFSSPDRRRHLILGRLETEPGAGLVPIMEALLEMLRGEGYFREVASVRRTRIAGRDALEVAGSGDPADGEEAARLLISLDPDRAHYRTLVMRGEDTEAAPLDAAYKRLIRDWTPLEDRVWNRSLERLRQERVDHAASPVWAERNRLFDLLGRPEAIGQAWIEERLRSLAGRDPLLLLDGLFHHHPRVRIGCLEAIDPAAVEEPMRTALYAAAMSDSDPAVRFRAAHRIAGEPAVVAAVLDRLLEVDTEPARAGAFQLLAAAPEARRTELVVAAFGEWRQYPAASHPLLAAVLAEWGPRAEAETLLGDAWRRSRSEDLARTAWLTLLALGDAEAITAARARLDQPLEPSLLTLSAAATSAAVHAEAVSAVEPWRLLTGSLERASEDASDSDTEADLEAGRETLEELISHLESLPETPTRDDECEALGGLEVGGRWVGARRRRLGCPAEPAAGLVRASVPRPGADAFALLDLLDRLEVGSAVQNQAFHSILEQLHRKIDDWAGDPVTTRSIGVDLDAPWRLEWWSEAEGGGDGVSGRGGVSLRLSSGDPARLLDTVVRASSGPLDLEKLAGGIFFSNSMALLPVGLAALWSGEQELLAGTDTDSSTPAPTETWVALGPAASPVGAGGAELRILYRLEVDEEGPHWRLTHLVRHGAEVTVSHAAGPRPAPAGSAEPAPGPPSYSARIEVDLGRVFEQFATGETPGDLQELGLLDLSFSAHTAFEAEAIATSFRLGGMKPEWLSLVANASPRELRAPRELLPANCLAWVGLRLEPRRLAERVRDGSLELIEGLEDVEGLEDLRPVPRRRLLDLLDHLDGEVGAAIVGVPDPRTDAPGREWAEHLVVYLSVDPEAGERFLKKAVRKREEHAGRRLYRLGDLFLAQAGRFLVAGADPEVLSALGPPPHLASSPVYERLSARAPAAAVAWAGWDSDRIADALSASIRAREESEGSTFPVEIFRSFGGIVGWLRRDRAALVGELSSAPRLQSEETRARVHRLAGYGDLTWGSVGARGLPDHATADLAPSSVEMTLRLPEDAPGVDLAWANERLDQEVVEPGLYRLVSRIAAPLPETSTLTLPIRGPDLLPWSRNEHDLDLHSDEIRDLAETLRGDQTDPARIVRAIVDWAHDSLDYTLVRDEMSAERILATRQADCTEFTQLTIALARSLGIPTRPVQGVYVGRSAAYFHRWAEVHLDRWYEVDPTWGVVQVPPTNLRIPFDDGLFLASLPEARFTVQAVHGGGGGWARRLPDGPAPDGDEPTEIAVDGDRVLLVLPAAEKPTATGRRVLYSADGGRRFAEIPPPARSGRLVRTLGGHGKLLWFHRPEEPGAGLDAYQLDRERSWRRVRLPPALGEGGEWTPGLQRDGFLALGGSPSRLLRLDRDLASAEPVPLPEDGGGEWVLARERALLARSAEGGGITLHRWTGSGWTTPVEIADSAELKAIAVRLAGDRTEVMSRHRSSGQLMRLIVGPESQTRRSASPAEAAALAATTLGGDGEWTVWADAGDQVLTRRPVDPAASEEPPGGPEDEPEEDGGEGRPSTR